MNGYREEVSSRACSKGVCWGREGPGLTRLAPARLPAQVPTPALAPPALDSSLLLRLAVAPSLLLMPGCLTLGTEASPLGSLFSFLACANREPGDWIGGEAGSMPHSKSAMVGLGGALCRGRAQLRQQHQDSFPRPPLRGRPFTLRFPLRSLILVPTVHMRVAARAVLSQKRDSRMRETAQ